ncbi:MAG: tetraacyldisaccharide 4'-kinase [Caldimonas sp.]
MASGPAPPEDPRRRAGGTVHELWAGRGAASTALLPLSWAFRGIVGLRRRMFRRGLLASHSLPVPVIVVGNLLVGGAGKTPTVIAVVALLRRCGRTPGIVSRGYGRDESAVREVRSDSEARRVGDEPLLLAKRTGVPVFVGRDRVAAGHALLQLHPMVDVVVSDDGLQHLALGRDVEVLVFDDRGTGNDRLLPAGPLREPLPQRLQANQLVLYSAGATSTPLPGFLGRRSLAGVAALDAWWRGEPPSPDSLERLRGKTVVAAAGLARPKGFFAMLRERGLEVVELPLPDHHDFRALPWPLTTGDVVVSEKDAVKIDPAQRIGSRIWVATLDFDPEPAFDEALLALLPPPVAPPAPAEPHGNSPA